MMSTVILGMILGISILKLKDKLDDNEKRQSYYYSTEGRKQNGTIIKELYQDLVTMFYIKKPGKFIGPLEPLNNTHVLKNLVMVDDNESYTINKKVIHLCTKDPKNGRYYNKNTLMYVILHELAHVLCNDIGHTENFSRIYTALLEHAIKYDYYDPSQPFVKNYCSL